MTLVEDFAAIVAASPEAAARLIAARWLTLGETPRTIPPEVTEARREAGRLGGLARASRQAKPSKLLQANAKQNQANEAPSQDPLAPRAPGLDLPLFRESGSALGDREEETQISERAIEASKTKQIASSKTDTRGSRCPNPEDPDAGAWLSRWKLPPLSDQVVGASVEGWMLYWCAVAGAKGLKRDWLATWRNRPKGLDKPPGPAECAIVYPPRPHRPSTPKPSEAPTGTPEQAEEVRRMLAEAVESCRLPDLDDEDLYP